MRAEPNYSVSLRSSCRWLVHETKLFEIAKQQKYDGDESKSRIYVIKSQNFEDAIHNYDGDKSKPSIYVNFIKSQS